MAKRGWEEIALLEAKRRATEESLRFWGQKEGESPRFNYRWEHIKVVVAIADALTRELGADREVVRAAAWLHDLAKQEIAEAGDGHGEASAEEAEKILLGTDFTQEKIPQVKEAIAKHVGLFRDSPLEPLEAAILWDADKLSKLGATGLVHFLMDNPAWQPGTATEDVLARGREWLDLAQKIVKSMNTPPGKRMAKERYQFHKNFYQQLAKELGANSKSEHEG